MEKQPPPNFFSSNLNFPWVKIGSLLRQITVNEWCLWFCVDFFQELQGNLQTFVKAVTVNKALIAQIREYPPHEMFITHLPLVPHICVSELGPHWLR